MPKRRFTLDETVIVCNIGADDLKAKSKRFGYSFTATPDQDINFLDLLPEVSCELDAYSYDDNEFIIITSISLSSRRRRAPRR